MSSSKQEIKDLQKVRATLEVVREATLKIHEDLQTAVGNQGAIADELKRAAHAIERM